MRFRIKCGMTKAGRLFFAGAIVLFAIPHWVIEECGNWLLRVEDILLRREIRRNTMCVVNIEIDEERLRSISSCLRDKEAIRGWLQEQVDKMMDDLSAPCSKSPNAHGPEEMHTILKERIHHAEHGEEKLIANRIVLDTIKGKYGF